jgi:GNAT superfamily N-acetyltransferase
MAEPAPVAIRRAAGAADMEDVATLFREYAASLEYDLAPQGFHEELASLPGIYAPPGGALFLARRGGEVLGSIALKPLEPGAAEVKRLYLRPGARGMGVGRALVEAVIAEAARLGYREIKLDTLPRMAAAIALYASFGFEPIAPYGSHPYPGLVCLGKRLG